MIYTAHYTSPLGNMLLAADDTGLTGAWFECQKYFAAGLADNCTETNTPILSETKRWLDIYFSGKQPDFTPPLHPSGTAFQQEVWLILLQIPYGQTTTYGDIAAHLAKRKNLARMSAQAVGGAVGHNPIFVSIRSLRASRDCWVSLSLWKCQPSTSIA